MASKHQSVLAYRGRRYLWAALALAAASWALYAWHSPPGPANGGTWLGYTLGTVAALLVVWLTALGLRKRSYASNLGTVSGWVSAHVYLGLSLLIIATLHTGFHFGWNVHTLAYALMCAVIVTGIVGIVLYVRYPERMSANRQGRTRDQLVEDIADLDAKAVRLAQALPPEFIEAVRSARDRLALGGDALTLLTARDHSRVVLPGAGGASAPLPNAGQSALLAWLGERLARSQDGELSARVQDLLTLVSAKRAAVERLKRDLRFQAWLDAWLYLHVPLTFALLATLCAHVVSVFVYW
jgi:hypothetical protein